MLEVLGQEKGGEQSNTSKQGIAAARTLLAAETYWLLLTTFSGNTRLNFPTLTAKWCCPMFPLPVKW